MARLKSFLRAVAARVRPAARSIVLSYVRAFIAFAGAAYVGGLDPSRKLDATWSLLIGAAWAAVPAGLRAIEAALAGATPSSLVWRVLLSFSRATVATALMAAVGPVSGAREAIRVVVVGMVPALLRALQEALDSTPNLQALARRGMTVVATDGNELPPPAPETFEPTCP